MGRVYKSIIVCLSLIFITNNLYANSIAKLIVKSSYMAFEQIEQMLVKKKFSKSVAKQISKSWEISISGLNKGVLPKTEAEFINLLKQSSALNAVTDMTMKTRFEKLSKEEISELVNTLALEVESVGWNKNRAYRIVDSCYSNEVREAVDKVAIKYLMIDVAKKDSNIWTKYMPSNSKDLLGSIRRYAKQKNSRIDDLKLIGAQIPKQERKAIFISLMKMNKGTFAEQELGKALRNFNTVNGSTEFLNNRLYNLLVSGLSHDELMGWSKILNLVSLEDSIDGISRNVNLVKKLESMAKQAAASGDKSLIRGLPILKKNRCYGIFK